MGTCYTLLMFDEFDWGYADTDKETQLKKFEEEFKSINGYAECIGEWYGYAVYDLGKSWPDYDPYKKIILKYCDGAYYYGDTAIFEIKRIEK